MMGCGDTAIHCVLEGALLTPTVVVCQVVFGFMSSVMKKIMEFEGKKMVESDKRIKLTGEVITVRSQTPASLLPTSNLK